MVNIIRLPLSNLLSCLFDISGYVYSFAIYLATLWNDKARQIVDGRRQTIEKLRSLQNSKGRRVWFHVSSLGEFEQARPLIEGLREKERNVQIILSFFSPSGYTVRKEYEVVDIVVYFPQDTKRAVREFLDVAQPDVAIFVKYEFWPTMLTELHKRSVRAILVSAIFSPNQLFFRPWGGWYRRLLETFEHLYVQDQASLELLSSVGIQFASISGDTRFDRVQQIASASIKNGAVEVLINRLPYLLIAGSTWPEDDRVLLPAWQADQRYGLILAPHELNQEYIDEILKQSKRPLRKLSELLTVEPIELNTLPFDGIIVDSFGLLSSLYRYAHVAYVGGGFGKGIHNTIEPAVYGLPILFAPKIDRFREAKDLVACGAGYVIKNSEEVQALLEIFVSNEGLAQKKSGLASRSYVISQLGATELILKSI